MNQKPIGSILERQVTRKQFLYMIGLAIMGITGVATVVDLLTGKGSNHTQSVNGFGLGVYGGNSAVTEVPKNDGY